jgi:hypothetical protein
MKPDALKTVNKVNDCLSPAVSNSYSNYTNIHPIGDSN